MGKKAQTKRLRKQALPQEPEAIAPQALPWPTGIRNAMLIFLLALFCAGAVTIRLQHLDTNDRSPDEEVYTYQAHAFAVDGSAGLRRIVNEFNANREAWSYPMPTRIGYIALVGTVMKMTGLTDVRAGIYVSTACSILTLLVILAIGLRFFNGWVAGTALLLMAVSPLDLAIARRSWQDGVLALCGALLVYLWCEIVSRPKNYLWFIPFVIVGSICPLIKETGVIIYGLCIIGAVGHLIFRARAILGAILLAICCGIGLCVSFYLLASTVGGASVIMTVLVHAKESLAFNPYVLEYQTGPWYRMLEGLWILVPGSMVLAAIGGSYVFAHRRDSEPFGPHTSMLAGTGITAFTAIFIGSVMLIPHGQNLRFISAACGMIYLLAGVGVWALVSYGRKKIRGGMRVGLSASIIVGVLIISAVEMSTYTRIFLDRGVRDITVKLLQHD